MHVSLQAMKGESHDPIARNQSCSNCDRKDLYLVWVDDQPGYFTASYWAYTTGFCRFERVDRYPFSIENNGSEPCQSLCSISLFHHDTLPLALPGHHLYTGVSGRSDRILFSD